MPLVPHQDSRVRRAASQPVSPVCPGVPGVPGIQPVVKRELGSIAVWARRLAGSRTLACPCFEASCSKAALPPASHCLQIGRQRAGHCLTVLCPSLPRKRQVALRTHCDIHGFRVYDVRGNYRRKKRLPTGASGPCRAMRADLLTLARGTLDYTRTAAYSRHCNCAPRKPQITRRTTPNCPSNVLLVYFYSGILSSCALAPTVLHAQMTPIVRGRERPPPALQRGATRQRCPSKSWSRRP